MKEDALPFRAMVVHNSQFDWDISNWDVKNVTNMTSMFGNSVLKKNNKIPNWYNWKD